MFVLHSLFIIIGYVRVSVYLTRSTMKCREKLQCRKKSGADLGKIFRWMFRQYLCSSAAVQKLGVTKFWSRRVQFNLTCESDALMVAIFRPFAPFSNALARARRFEALSMAQQNRRRTTKRRRLEILAVLPVFFKFSRRFWYLGVIWCQKWRDS